MKPALKNILTIAWICLWVCSVAAQTRKMSLSAEFRRKNDLSRKTDDNPESVSHSSQNLGVLRGGTIKLDYHIRPNWVLSAGLGFEPYTKLFAAKQNGQVVMNSNADIYLTALSLPVSVGYKAYLAKRIIFEPVIGVITNFRLTNGEYPPAGTQVFTGNTFLTLTIAERPGYELAVRRIFFTVDSRLQLRWIMRKRKSLVFGLGYTQGTQVIGRVNAEYRFPTLPGQAFYIQRNCYGSQWYLNSGLRFNIGKWSAKRE